MPDPFRSRFQVSVRTLLIATLAFGLGLAARNIASGLHPLTMQLLLPSSTTPISPGDSLIIECDKETNINRRVKVLADGTVSLKHVGIVDVSGLTVAEIQSLVRAEYKKVWTDSKPKSIQVFRAEASRPID